MVWGRLGIGGTFRSHPESTNFHRGGLQRQAHPLLQSIRLCGLRLGPREREYAELKGELDKVYLEQTTWLRIKVEDVHTATPIAYVDSDPQCVHYHVF